MADYLVTDTELTSIADAIRTKGGTSANLSFPTEFVSAINAIATGSTGKQVAWGTYTPSSNITSGYVTIKTVADLGFTPRLILLYYTARITTSNYTQMSVCIPTSDTICTHFGFRLSNGQLQTVFNYSNYTNGVVSAGDVGVKDNAMQFYANSSWGLYKGTYNWFAVEG